VLTLLRWAVWAGQAEFDWPALNLFAVWADGGGCLLWLVLLTRHSELSGLAGLAGQGGLAWAGVSWAGLGWIDWLG
jgi:hypothetical protein